MNRTDYSKCFCEDINFQTYGHVVCMRPPFVCEWEKTKVQNGKTFKGVPIDVCIATEIAELWHRGVETLNSCCGHGKSQASVIVDEANLNKMKELGYSRHKVAPSGLPWVALKTGTFKAGFSTSLSPQKKRRAREDTTKE